MVQYRRHSCSSICTVILWQDYYGRGNMRKTYCSTVGKRFPIGNAYSYTVRRVILIRVCGWHKIGWKETKSWSDVETTQQRSRFGRTNIFPWSCIIGLHSKTMWNKQRYCGQLQSHVWIANFRGRNREASILCEFLYFFVVLWQGRSCKEMCGAVLWVIKQDDSTTLQSICSLHRWPSL